MLSLKNLLPDLNNLEYEEEIEQAEDLDEMVENPLYKGKPMEEPKNTRISTLTAVCNLGVELNVREICSNLPIERFYENKEGIIRTEMFDYFYKEENKKEKVPVQLVRGSCKKDYIEKKKEKKPFFNAASIYIKIKLENGFSKEPNLKIFHNGGVQMTGINSVEMGEYVVDLFMNKIKKLNETVKICEDVSKMVRSPIRVCLVNSDFSLNFYLKRDILHRILVEKYDLNSSFESTNYQGVNTKFFWNKHYKGTKHFGKCVCEHHCNGKGDGLEIGKCKKITIAPFQTGKVIITGARNLEQLKDAKEFICDVISKHYGHIRSDRVIEEKKKIKTRRISKKKLLNIPVSSINFHKKSINPQPNLLDYLNARD
jgi:TATA-box binding protein (TBP) (component of TFIID and TFIIIB)